MRLVATRCAALFAGLAACGRVGFDPVSPDDGALSRDGAQLGPWGSPMRIDALSSSALDEDPTLTADQLEIYFRSARSGVSRIYVAYRGSPTDPWGPPAIVPELIAASGDEGAPSIDADGLTLLLTSNRAGSMSYDIWMSTRGMRGTAWSMPSRVAELSSAIADYPGCLRAGGRRMVVTRGVEIDPTMRDLYETNRVEPTVPWSAPSPIVELTTPEAEASGCLDDSALHLVGARQQPGGTGPRDLFESQRPNLTAPFEDPVAISELNTNADDEDPWISTDRSYIVFSSDRSGNSDLYEARR